ncbi:MAG: sigma-70 family RNA polymerase sigma factor [Intrasporangiaceae bacterium]|nr:sigma-70 family RNA polymerase sigma factor [Intrasporangiaceae bacterium]
MAEQERFCAAVWPRLVAALAHYCGDVHVAEELVQEALVRACRRWPHVSQLSSPEGWTYRVAVNLANSMLRRQRAERRAYARHGPAEPLARSVGVEDQQAVDAALRSLTDRQREVVILRFLLDLSVEQTAELLGRRPGAVRALTHRAITRLRSSIDVADPASEEANDVT